MQTLRSILAASLLLGCGAPSLHAAAHLSVDFFHDNLEEYGDWREVGDYGYCWQPRDVGKSWRPYSDGRWLYTDAGWTWDSEEPYAWAVYHYGRWARVENVGWVWKPGTEWGPAWVSWRRSPQHVGWAPLPPDAEFDRDTGFSVRVDADYDIGPMNYNFVAARDFGSPRLRGVIVRQRDNFEIIRETTNITNITYVNNAVYNDGPQYDAISRQSKQPIRRLKLEREREVAGDSGTVRAEQMRAHVQGGSLRVVTLPVEAKAATAPHKVAARVEKAQVDRGWKNAGSAAAVEKLRTKMKSEPPKVAQAPASEKATKPAEAPVVVTDETKPAKASKPQKPVKTEKPKIPAVSKAPAPAPKVAEKPVAEKPVAEKPVAEKPVAEKPVAEKPVAEKPVVEKPAPKAPAKERVRKADETPRPAAKPPQPVRVPKAEAAAPIRKAPEKVAERPHTIKPAVQPKPAPPAPRKETPKAPAPQQMKKPEARPSPPQAPSHSQPAEGEQKPGKKGKGKPEEAVQ